MLKQGKLPLFADRITVFKINSTDGYKYLVKIAPVEGLNGVFIHGFDIPVFHMDFAARIETLLFLNFAR